MSQFLDRAGKHLVTLSNCYWAEAKNGNGYVANLTGTTKDGQYITAYMPATETIIQRGRDQGKTLATRTIETLQKIGMPADPTKIDELDGKEAIFVCDFEDGQDGQPRLRVQYVNPLGGAEKADPNKVANFFGRIGQAPGAPAPTPAAAPAPTPGPVDEIPF